MPKRKVKTKRLDSGIDFEEEAVCERKVLQGRQDCGGGSRLGRKEVQDRMTKREWQKASRPLQLVASCFLDQLRSQPPGPTPHCNEASKKALAHLCLL